jgi:hypothetical protein
MESGRFDCCCHLPEAIRTRKFDLQGSITIKIGQTDRREIEKADIIQGTQTV